MPKGKQPKRSKTEYREAVEHLAEIAFDIEQGKRTMIIYAELPSLARYIRKVLHGAR